MKWTAAAAIFGIGANALYIPRSTTEQIQAHDPHSCGFELGGSFEFPHLIVPVNSSAPDHAPGTSYHGEVSSTITSLFNFDVPAKPEVNTCSLVFLFPGTSERPSDTYTFEGDGHVRFNKLESPARPDTTYNNAPEVAEQLGYATLAPGNSIHVSTFPCTRSETLAFEIENAGSTTFRYFQDYGVPPIGLYLTRCRK